MVFESARMGFPHLLQLVLGGQQGTAAKMSKAYIVPNTCQEPSQRRLQNLQRTSLSPSKHDMHTAETMKARRVHGGGELEIFYVICQLFSSRSKELDFFLSPIQSREEENMAFTGQVEGSFPPKISPSVVVIVAMGDRDVFPTMLNGREIKSSIY